LRAIADFVKRTTIAELDQMPNHYVHTLYHQLWLKTEYDKKHPKEAEEKAMGNVLAEGLSDLT
jgi:hypothetical protein